MRPTAPQTSQNTKKWMWTLSILLFVGLLGFSIMFFLLNKNIDPLDPANDIEILEQRFVWRERADLWLGVFLTLYLLGNVVLLYQILSKRIVLPIKSWSLYFVSQLAVMLAGSLPFGLLDRYFLQDYLLAPVPAAASLTLLFVIGLVALYSTKRKLSQPQ